MSSEPVREVPGPYDTFFESGTVHGIWDYSVAFALFSCRCGQKFETGAALDEHLEAL